jgi:hypothetical protein
MRRLCYYGRYMTSGHLIYMQQGTPEGSTQAPQPAHEIVMILNFADELRRCVPVGK